MSSVPVTPRSKQMGISAIDNHATLEVPLDFSFLSITDLSELQDETPRASGKHTFKKTDDNKWVSKCLKVNNNALPELKEFTSMVESLVFEPAAITWFDFSFNDLTAIHPGFCDYPNLQILYLHGNQIGKLEEADKLAGIKKLKKLSLHGNPIENVKNYRLYMLSQIPQLQSFDMSAITKADRTTASCWNRSNLANKKKKKKDDDD